jgi:hypothetical protein
MVKSLVTRSEFHNIILTITVTCPVIVLNDLLTAMCNCNHFPSSIFFQDYYSLGPLPVRKDAEPVLLGLCGLASCKVIR